MNTQPRQCGEQNNVKMPENPINKKEMLQVDCATFADHLK